MWLHNNKITEIKGLEQLINLETLSLNKNKITEIKGLDQLIKLENIDLSTNPITKCIFSPYNNIVRYNTNYVTPMKHNDITNLRNANKQKRNLEFINQIILDSFIFKLPFYVIQNIINYTLFIEKNNYKMT